MKLNSLKDLLVAELQDLMSAEKQIQQIMPQVVRTVAHAELRSVLEEHAEEGKRHVERLEKCFQLLGIPSHTGRSHGMIGLVSAWMELKSLEAQADVRDAATISSIQRMEHYEIAGYGCARAFAEQLEETAVADLLQETLEEEESCDRRLTELAETLVNAEAESHSM